MVLAIKSLVAKINYDDYLAQKCFLKSVEIGLSSEHILFEITSLLRDPTISNEDLIFAVS